MLSVKTVRTTDGLLVVKETLKNDPCQVQLRRIAGNNRSVTILYNSYSPKFEFMQQLLSSVILLPRLIGPKADWGVVTSD